MIDSVLDRSLRAAISDRKSNQSHAKGSSARGHHST